MIAEHTLLVREVGIALSGLVAGMAAISMYQYRKEFKHAKDGAKRSLQLAGWTAMTIGIMALFQGSARAFLILKGDSKLVPPLDWKDWGVILIQLNAFILLYVTARHERQWRDHDD